MTFPWPAPRNPVDLLGEAAARVRREIVLAHFIGKIAVQRGVREARQQLDGVVRSMGGPAEHGEPTDAPHDATVPVDSVSPSPPEPATITQAAAARPRVETLALADYDQLPAAHVVAKLAGLDQDERDEIEAYETLGRHRRTILGKLALLREASGA